MSTHEGGVMDNEQLAAAKLEAEEAWEYRLRCAPAKATVTGWQTGTTPSGELLLSGRVEGPDHLDALHRFAVDAWVGMEGNAQRPAYDYSVPGRIECVWRTGGVWVQLWHPDTARPTPALLAAFPKPQRPMAVTATPSGRLRFRRNKKQPL